MSKFSNLKLKYTDKENQWYENFNKKTGYKIWKSMRIINWIIFIIVIPLLPILAYSLGFDNVLGSFDALKVQWALILTLIVFCIFFITIILQWWFSRFSDYLDSNEQK